MAIRCVVGLACVWLSLGAMAQAQDHCQFGNPEAGEHFEKALKAAKSCADAEKQYNDCRWGSSADVGFGGIVIDRCERDFLSKLSIEQKKHYTEEMHLCGYEYARQQGTLSISDAATCAVDVSARYSADPKLADVPAPRASFDCGKAQTRLELAICSDAAVGRADLVLGRVYAPTVKFLKEPDRAKLIASEREWLKGLPGRCELGTQGAFSTKALACLRNEIEIRFTVLDACGDGGGLEGCLDPSFEEAIREAGQADDAKATASKN